MADLEDKQFLYDRQDGKCFWCGRDMLKLEGLVNDPLSPTVDHIIPRKAGGEKWGRNVRMACYECNGMRSVFNPSAFSLQLKEKQSRIDNQVNVIHSLTQARASLIKENQRLLNVIVSHIESSWFNKLKEIFNEFRSSRSGRNRIVGGVPKDSKGKHIEGFPRTDGRPAI